MLSDLGKLTGGALEMESEMILEDGLDLSGAGQRMSVAVRVTEAGRQELKHAQKGLSVWQRRLLLALQTHESLDLALNSDPVLRRPQLNSDLARLLELKLLIHHQSAAPVPGTGDDDGRLAMSTRHRGRGSASPLGRLPLLAIAVGAICAAVVFAYFLVRPATKVSKPSPALFATQLPPSPAVAGKPAAIDVPELPGKVVAPPSPAPVGTPPSTPALVPSGEAPKKSVAATKEVKATASVRGGDPDVAKSRNTSPPTRPAGEAKPTADTQAPPPPPPEEVTPAAPREKPLAAEGGTSLVARTEPSLRKTQACPTPTYPADSLMLREEGTVELRFLIDVDGNVAEAKIASSSGSSRLDTAARDVLSRCRFVPGTVNGKPEPAWARLRYTWRLE